MQQVLTSFPCKASYWLNHSLQSMTKKGKATGISPSPIDRTSVRQKCHLMTIKTSCTDTSIHVGNAQIKESSEEKLLGVTLDKHLTFKPHVSNLCKKANQNIHGLARISKYMETNGKNSLINENVYNVPYCPL